MLAATTTKHSPVNDSCQVPRPAGVKPLKGHRPWLQVRVGDYRIIYDVDNTTRTVTVTVLGHRREVYRSLDL